MQNKCNGVPWSVALEDEIITEYAGIKLRDYYTNSKVMLDAQLKAKEKFQKLYGIGRFVKIGPTYSSYLEGTMLGVKVFFPKDDVPWPDKKPLITDIREVDKLRILNPFTEGLMAKYIKTYLYMKEKVGNKYSIELEGENRGPEGPITTAVIIRGQDFFMDIYDHPRDVHKLVKLVTEVSLLMRRTIEKVIGIRMKSTWIKDDYAGMLTPAQYEEFVLPYYQKIYQEFGEESRILHSELLRKEHLKLVDPLRLTWYSPASSSYLAVKDILEVIGPIFTYQIKPQELINGSPESIRMRYRQLVKQGAPEIETYPIRGVPSENLKAAIAIAKEFE